MKVLLACALYAVFVVIFASASCRNRRPKFMKHKWSDKKTFYCEYEGMMFGDGSSFTDLKRCMRCDCTTGGLSCCGIGYKAGVIFVPGCVVAGDVCTPAILNLQKTGLCKIY